jgi:hypothetical protein
VLFLLFFISRPYLGRHRRDTGGVLRIRYRKVPSIWLGNRFAARSVQGRVNPIQDTRGLRRMRERERERESERESESVESEKSPRRGWRRPAPRG